MPSDLQITNIKDQANANSAITIASDGQVTVNQNNPTLTLGSNATGFTGPKIVDVWRLNTEFQGTANPITNLTRATNANDGSIGSAMTTPAHGETNAGVFTFPMPGIYQISFRSLHKIGEASLNLTYAGTCINKVISGSVSSLVQSYFARATTASSANFYYFNYCNIIFDCTNTSTDKVSFATNDLASSSVYTMASTTANTTAMFFTRIGDT
jgi:hypothetical protein